MVDASSDNARTPWRARDGDVVADALVAAMRLSGIEQLFFVSGSELVFYQEAIAKASARRTPTPDLRTITNEHLAINCALGNAMVRGRPAATAAHVDVGTLHYGAGIHTAWRGGYPVLMTAGTGPRAATGEPFGRSHAVHWFQEPRDQGGIVRQYTKADHRLEHQDDPGLIVSRLLQLALADRSGPVYLSIPMETAMLPLAEGYTFPTAADLGAPTAPAPDRNAVQEVARLLVDAERPVISTASSGRDPAAVGALVAVAELLSIPVVEPAHASRMNFPRRHWASAETFDPDDADLLIVIDDEVPYVAPAGVDHPPTVWVGGDPVQSTLKTQEFRADLRITAAASQFAAALVEEIEPLLTPPHRRRIDDRRRRLEAARDERCREREVRVDRGRRGRTLNGDAVAAAVARRLDATSIVVDDGVSNGSAVRWQTQRTEPGTYFRSGGSAGGWGGGAAVGAKLGSPAHDVVHFTGDGYFLFGNPLATLLAAAAHAAPTLTVVFANASYSTGTSSLAATFPDGHAVARGDYVGGRIDPEPDYVALARAGGAVGFAVRTSDELDAAVDEAFDVVRSGQAAIIAAHVVGPLTAGS